MCHLAANQHATSTENIALHRGLHVEKDFWSCISRMSQLNREAFQVTKPHRKAEVGQYWPHILQEILSTNDRQRCSLQLFDVELNILFNKIQIMIISYHDNAPPKTLLIYWMFAHGGKKTSIASLERPAL